MSLYRIWGVKIVAIIYHASDGDTLIDVAHMNWRRIEAWIQFCLTQEAGTKWPPFFRLQITIHNNGVIMGARASQITNLATVYSTVYWGADQRKHQGSTSLAFVWGIHRWPVNSPHKGPVTRKMFSFDDVIMKSRLIQMMTGYRIGNKTPSEPMALFTGV